MWLQPGGQRGLKVLRQRGDASNNAGPAAAPLDRKRPGRRPGGIVLGQVKDNFGSTLDQRERGAQPDNRAKLPHGNDHHLLVAGASLGHGGLYRWSGIRRQTPQRRRCKATGCPEKLAQTIRRGGFSGRNIFLVWPPLGRPQDQRPARALADRALG